MCRVKSLFLVPFSIFAVAIASQPSQAQLLPRPSVPSTVAPLSFDDIFAGLDAPLSYKIKDLKGEWRLVTIKSRPDLDNAPIVPSPPKEMLLTAERLRNAVGAGDGQYVTQGQTVAAGGELFLVTYKMDFDEAEMQSALEAEAKRTNRTLPLPPQELSAAMEAHVRERPLQLRLLNVKMLGEISDIRAFDAAAQSKALRDFLGAITAEADIATGEGNSTPATPATSGTGLIGSPTYAPPAGTGSTTPPATIGGPGGLLPPSNPVINPPANATTLKPPVTSSTGVKPLPPTMVKPMPVPGLAERNTDSQKNLHLIGLALIAYAQDHNGTLPPAQTPGIARKVLTFYAGSDKIWARGDNSQAYLPNPKMSGRKTSHISNPDEWVAFYEANPAADGTRGVVFLDGHVARIPSADWARAKKASKLP